MEPRPVNKTEIEAEFMKEKYEKMVELFKNKNEAYGDSFGRSVQKYGPIAALTRMSDKWNRIEALILGATNNVVDEKLEDTLVDMANYCLMTLYEIGMLGVRELDKSPWLKLERFEPDLGELKEMEPYPPELLEVPPSLGIWPNCAIHVTECDCACPKHAECVSAWNQRTGGRYA